jgi:hypothetical protein
MHDYTVGYILMATMTLWLYVTQVIQSLYPWMHL